MTKTGTFFIDENMRLNCKHFCPLMHKVDYDILLLESKLCKRCKRRAFCIDPIIAISQQKKFFLGGAPIVGTPYADLCFIKHLNL